MPRGYALVRPYQGTLGERVVRCVEELGLTVAEGPELPLGTPDERCAQWIARSDALLFVVPFHMHRGGEREVLDGIGVLERLSREFKVSERIWFMPVRDFSWAATFQRRLDDLKSMRPELAQHLVTAHEEEIDSAPLRARLRRRLDDLERPERRRSPTLSGRSAARSSGSWTFPPNIFTPAAEQASVSSIPPPVTQSRLRKSDLSGERETLRPPQGDADAASPRSVGEKKRS